MTDYSFTSDLEATDDRIRLLDGDDYVTVAAGVTLKASGIIDNNPRWGAEGFYSSGFSDRLDILGSVVSANGHALYLRGMNDISIGAAGSVSAFYYGIVIYGSAEEAGRTTLNNQGTISGNDGAISSLEGAVTINNSGTIRAGSQGSAIELGGADDRLINTGLIEGYIFLGNGDDFYDGRGGRVTKSIILGQGNNTAYGGDGRETFVIDEGTNVIDGGGGINTIEIMGGSTVDLRIEDPQQTGHGLYTLRNIQNITSSYGIDHLTGNDLENGFAGGGADDVLDGGGADDFLSGQGGNDILIGGTGNDTLDGGIEPNDGSPGSDTARYSGDAAVTVSLKLQNQRQDTGGYGLDFLVGIENLEGGRGNDTLIGDDNRNKLIGNDGDDTLNGGKGPDTLDGGAGTNTAVFAGNRADYGYVTTDGVTTVTSQLEGIDELRNIRFLEFADGRIALYNTRPDNIAFSKTAFAENLLVNTPLATLSAHDAEGDAITYTLSDPTGTFSLDGTALVLLKPLDYETNTSYSVTVTAKDQYGLETTQEITLSVSDIADTPGNPGDPGTPVDSPLTLNGTAGDDTLAGKGANDILYGFGGKDQLYGNGGNDRLSGGLGNDTLTGGAGQDVFVFDAKLAKTNTLNKQQNLDRILDFVVADDTIHLAKSVFSKISKKGVLKKGEFFVGSAAHDRDDRVIYNKKTGALF
ncbi:cadherin domain-containing protein [Microvirga calopogonii]|uniref:cadherin domain-containing protein n=1 Tax=Microvirga calopogonii TaxID=2078013 RepID=UPI000E0DF0B6|nr:cadherin domain-containing protein [Microvirga calopogonii]